MYEDLLALKHCKYRFLKTDWSQETSVLSVPNV